MLNLTDVHLGWKHASASQARGTLQPGSPLDLFGPVSFTFPFCAWFWLQKGEGSGEGWWMQRVPAVGGEVTGRAAASPVPGAPHHAAVAKSNASVL